MAGSRLDRIGTIYSRTSGLLKAGGIKYQDRPIWFDIYRVFPPKYEPHIDRESEKKEITPILYKEDKYRALFFKKFGLNPGGVVRNLNDRNFEDPSQSFVSSCLELGKTHPEWDDIHVFEKAAENYKSSGTFDRMKSTDGANDDADVMAERDASKLHGRKPPTLTAQSLLSLFKEAKEQQSKNMADETQKQSSSSKPSSSD